MGNNTGRQVPFKEGMMKLPQSPSDKGHLLGSKCKKCGEQFFIRRDICEKCQGATWRRSLSETGESSMRSL